MNGLNEPGAGRADPMQQAELPQPTTAAPLAMAGAGWGAAWAAAMATGDFAAAWQVSDAVLAARPAGERDDPGQPYHQRWVWDGTPLEGRSVLVRCYHGLGDTLQFCRYLPSLRLRAAQVTLEVQPALIPLLVTMGAVDRIVAFDPAAPLAAEDCDVEIMELAHALRIAPVPVPYLSVPYLSVGMTGVAAARLRVGLCWQTSASWRPNRSVPVAALAELMKMGVAWQSLQQGAGMAGMAPCPAVILETARVIAGLDLVITIDTMVAHLAGAIGIPVWLLLDTEPDWRWWAGGRGSPWYRGVRKYRQAVAGAWDTAVAAVASDLTRCVRRGTVEV